LRQPLHGRRDAGIPGLDMWLGYPIENGAQPIPMTMMMHLKAAAAITAALVPK